LVYTDAMSNLLDLKYRQPGVMPEPPVEAVAAQVEEPVAVVETEDVTEDYSEEEADDIADTALLASLPMAVSWEAHHPLQGFARQKHVIFSGLLVIFGALIGLWQHSIVPFLVLVCGAVTLEVRERWGKPSVVEINERGVKVNGQLYEHAAFASFHIHTMPDNTLELSLKSDRRMLPHLRLPLGEQDPYELHATLLNYIPEGEHKIPLVDYFLRKPRT